MSHAKRVFVIVLDSFGVGEMPDSADFGDKGANTLRSCFETGKLNVPNMRSLGLFNIDGVTVGEPIPEPMGAYLKIAERSRGKDTTTGHWEIAGIVSAKPFPTYPNGFPEDVIRKFSEATGRGVLCNKPYSGTKVIADYGEEHIRTGDLIVYTSADSVFQIAAHESVVPVETLYEYCRMAREILTGENAVGRVIARPFEGEFPFTRTPRRHDFSLLPPKDTMLDCLSQQGFDAIGIGKIYDIFAGRGLTKYVRDIGNFCDMNETSHFQSIPFNGLCFTNLVDFDMQYGHRRDPEGYAQALNEFDVWLGGFLEKMLPEDVLIITADHGCDPKYSGTDHTREHIPVLIAGQSVRPADLGIRACFGDIGATVLDMLGASGSLDGESFANKITY